MQRTVSEMNDIRLNKINGFEEKYDWNFGFNDLDVCRGNSQLVNAVRHAVLTRPGELVQEAYQDSGCEAHNYALLANTQTGEQYVLRSLEATAKNVDGIYSAQASVIEKEDKTTRIQLDLMTTEMEEVTIYEI